MKKLFLFIIFVFICTNCYAAGWFGNALRIEESDGSPSFDFSKLIVSDGTLSQSGKIATLTIGTSSINLSDSPPSATWDTITTYGATLNSLYDFFVKFDTDLDGRVDILDPELAFTSGTLTIAGSGGSNNESLTIDFETTADRIDFDSSTGAIIEFDDEIIVGGTSQSLFTEGIVVNDGSGGDEDDDFIVETDGNANAFEIDAGDNTITNSVATTIATGVAFNFGSNRIDDGSDKVDDDMVAFDDADSNFTATTIGAAIEELDDDSGGSAPNQADYKVNWNQIGNMPAGFADGSDDATAGSGNGDVLYSTLTLDKSFNLETPADTDTNVMVWLDLPYQITVTSLYGKLKGGTSANIAIGNGTQTMDTIAATPAGTNDDGSIANATFATGDTLEAAFSSVTGSPTWGGGSIHYRIDTPHTS